MTEPARRADGRYEVDGRLLVGYASTGYESQSARDAERTGYGKRSYWDYLELAAFRHYAYFASRGDLSMAEQMLTRSLSESLQGNDGA